MLLHDDIFEYMAEFGYEFYSNPNGGTFQQKEERQPRIVIDGQRITCRTWNDEGGAERYCVSVEINKTPALDLKNWVLLMHLAGIITLGAVERAARRNGVSVMKIITAKNTTCEHY